MLAIYRLVYMTVMISYFARPFLPVITMVLIFDGVRASTVDQDRINLVRNLYGDYFKNVFSSGPSDTNDTFCRSVDAYCMSEYPTKHDKCSYCQCNSSTYIEPKAKCEQPAVVQEGCILKFYKEKNIYVNIIDVSDEGKQELFMPGLVKHNHTKNCSVGNIAQMTANGYNSLTKDIFWVDKTDDGKKVVKIEWDDMDKSYRGSLYRINITCEMEKHEDKGPREKYKMNQCVVLKTKGNMSVKHPGLPTSPTKPSTTVIFTAKVPTITKTPSSKAPATEAPATKAPVTKEPVTKDPVTKDPVSTLAFITSDMITSRSTDESELTTLPGEGEPAKNEEMVSKKSGTTVIYLSVAIVVMAVVITIGSIYFFRAKILKRIEALFGGDKHDSNNSNLVEDQPVYETPDKIEMHVIENADDAGVYTYADNQEMSKSRLGIENEIYNGATGVNEYSSLDECRNDDAVNYQSLIMPRTEPTKDDATYLTALPEPEQRVYSVLEEEQPRDRTSSNQNDGIVYVIPADKKPFEDDDYVVLTR